MSWRREVLIRILALLQRKTLIETKNRTLKCLKRHYSTVRSMKNVAALTEDGAFALFFCKAQESSPPVICHPRQKMLMPGGQPGGGEGLGAAGIDWCITQNDASAGLLSSSKRCKLSNNNCFPGLNAVHFPDYVFERTPRDRRLRVSFF